MSSVYIGNVALAADKLRGNVVDYKNCTIYYNENESFYWSEDARGFLHLYKPVAKKNNIGIPISYSITECILKVDGSLRTTEYGQYNTRSEAENAIKLFHLTFIHKE